MTDSVSSKTTDAPVDPNAAAKKNDHLAVSGRPLEAASVPDSQKDGASPTGHVPPPKGAKDVTGTGTIPAVDDTTLTQVPHPATLGKGAVPNAEPFGREMNHPGAVPGEHFVRDPQVFPTDPTSRKGEGNDTVQVKPVSSASVGGQSSAPQGTQVSGATVSSPKP